jgi:deoxyribonuclease-1-like protein
MAKFILLAIIAALVIGGVFFFRTYNVDTRFENGKLSYLKITPKVSRGSDSREVDRVPARAPRPAFRIATLNLSRLDERKLANLHACDILSKVVPQFELVAVQGLFGQTQAVVARLIEQINASGRHYAFAACPSGQRNPDEEFSAFLFDETAVEVDPATLHLVADPAGRFQHPPLVAGFRVRGPAEEEAFTFKLINVQSSADRAAVELDLLRNVFKTVRDDKSMRDDGLMEDDIIVLGDLGADEDHLGQLGQMADIVAAVSATPTNVRGTRREDNILFDRRATCEFTGRSGVVDLMREFGLSLDEALAVCEHLPVWSEFSSYEGGQPGRIAVESDATVR